MDKQAVLAEREQARLEGEIVRAAIAWRQAQQHNASLGADVQAYLKAIRLLSDAELELQGAVDALLARCRKSRGHPRRGALSPQPV